MSNLRQVNQAMIMFANANKGHLPQMGSAGTGSEMIDVTARVQNLVTKHGVMDGYVIVYVPHTTAAVTINENADPDVKSDMLKKLETLIPKREPYYEHAEGNSDSHVKTSLVGNSGRSSPLAEPDTRRLVIGIPAALVHYVLMGVLSLTIVASFEAVGANPAAVRVLGNAIVLELMRFADELADLSSYRFPEAAGVLGQAHFSDAQVERWRQQRAGSAACAAAKPCWPARCAPPAIAAPPRCRRS